MTEREETQREEKGRDTDGSMKVEKERNRERELRAVSSWLTVIDRQDISCTNFLCANHLITKQAYTPKIITFKNQS